MPKEVRLHDGPLGGQWVSIESVDTKIIVKDCEYLLQSWVVTGESREHISYVFSRRIDADSGS